MRETELQNEILLTITPLIAWGYVTTTGTVKGIKGGRPFKVGNIECEDLKKKTGLADIIGQLKNGKLFAIEVKLPGKEPTEEQYEFLDMVQKNGGVSGWADNVEDAIMIINPF